MKGRWGWAAGSLLAALLVVAFPAATLAAGSFTNGNFDGGTYSGGLFETLSAGLSTANAMPGWTVTGGSVDWINNYWQQPVGVTKSIDMNGTPVTGQSSTVGVVSQTFATDANATYVATFDFAGNPVCGPTTKTLKVTATGTAAMDFSFDTSTTSRTDMGWVMKGYSFVPTSDTTTLTFASVGGNTSNCGAALADVALTETVATGAQCKNGGWETMFEPDGTPFKNQGDCVSYYAISGATPIGS